MTRVLGPAEVEAVVQAAIRANLVQSQHRHLLLAGIDIQLSSQWPSSLSPAFQLRSDLDELVRLPPAPGPHIHPLLLWLDNARKLSEPRAEGIVFLETHQRVRLRLDAGVSAQAPTYPENRQRSVQVSSMVQPSVPPRAVTSDGFSLIRMFAGRTVCLVELTVALTLEHERVRVAWFSGGRPLPIESRLTDRPEPGLCGDGLMALLFPSEKHGECAPAPVLAAFGQPPEPRACSLRLRICTSDEGMASLPWHALTYEGRLVVSSELPWTVELTDCISPTIVVRQPRWPRVIIVGAESSADDLRSAVAISSPEYARAGRITAARDGDVLALQLVASARAIVIVCADPEESSAHLLHALGDPASSARSVAVLCIVGDLDARPPLYMLSRTPLIIQFADFDDAKRWLIRVAVDAIDPIVAAYATAPRGLQDTGAGWSATRNSRSCTVMSSYRSWHARQVLADHPPPPAEVLDRRLQRNWVTERLSAMTDAPHSRLEVFVASGQARHRIDLLSKHLESHIRERMPDVYLQVYRPSLPRARNAPHSSGAPGRGDRYAAAMSGALRNADVCSPRDVVSAFALGRRPLFARIVWLDWGTYGVPGRPDREEKLLSGELREWLVWHVELAEAAREHNLCIASFIGCQTDRSTVLTDVIDDVALETDLSTVEFNLLPALQPVTVTEIRQYLNNPRHSRVPQEQVGRLTRAIVRASAGGSFDSLVELLDLGQRIGWYALLARLEGNRGSRVNDDVEL